MPSKWESMSIEELFELHQQIQLVLREKLIAKKKLLENRLRRINVQSDGEGRTSRRRSAT